MEALEHFEINGVRFVVDLRAGAERRRSTTREFVLVKNRGLRDFYESLQSRAPKTILELGMFEGGSIVYFDKLYQPERLVGVDIKADIPPLDEYSAGRDHIRTLYRQSQDDPGLPAKLHDHFPIGIDLIIDDACHWLAETRAAFHLCFPLLRPGGLYVIEDWAWSHLEPYQSEQHPWYDRPALTNLIFELVVNTAVSLGIREMTVRRELVIIEKAPRATGEIDLAEGLQRLRGRDLHLL